MTIYLGVDDGHNTTNLVASNGIRICIPSRATNGEKVKVKISGELSDKTCVYECKKGNVFTLGDIENSLPTNINEYPFSDLNRAIVFYALHVAGIDVLNEDIVITTGLPFKHYYKNKKPNEKLIDAKINNLMPIEGNPQIKSKNGFPIPNIVSHMVLPEGVAAWFNFAMDVDKETGQVVPNKEFLSKKIAIVDIGGRTTDIVVVQNFDTDSEYCATIDVGMLNVHEVIREAVLDEYEVRLSNEEIDRAVEDDVVKMYGEMVDIKDIVNQAKLQVIGEINNEVKKKLGNGSIFDKIIFVGGGASVFENYLKDWFPRNGMIAENPIFSNAEGMLKCSLNSV